MNRILKKCQNDKLSNIDIAYLNDKLNQMIVESKVNLVGDLLKNILKKIDIKTHIQYAIQDKNFVICHYFIDTLYKYIEFDDPVYTEIIEQIESFISKLQQDLRQILIQIRWANYGKYQKLKPYIPALIDLEKISLLNECLKEDTYYKTDTTKLIKEQISSYCVKRLWFIKQALSNYGRRCNDDFIDMKKNLYDIYQFIERPAVMIDLPIDELEYSK
jgi:hypothetical protein